MKQINYKQLSTNYTLMVLMTCTYQLKFLNMLFLKSYLLQYCICKLKLVFRCRF